MRTYTLLIAFGLALITLLSAELFVSQSKNIDLVEVTIKPNTLDLKRHGVWITAYIEVSKPYDAEDINVSTVMLEGAIPVQWSAAKDNTLMVKFDASTVINYLWTTKLYHMGTIRPQENVQIPLTITGKFLDGTAFEGSDTIKVINP